MDPVKSCHGVTFEVTLRKFPGPWAETAGHVKCPPPCLVLLGGVGWSQHSDAGGGSNTPTTTGAT